MTTQEARAALNEYTLTDSSTVYDVVLYTSDGGEVVFASSSEKQALLLLSALYDFTDNNRLGVTVS